MMQIAIEGPSHAPTALLMPGGRRLPVETIIDRWPGNDHLYLAVRCKGGGHFIVRHDRNENIWEVAVYRAPDGEYE